MQLRTVCGHQNMIRGRDISPVVALRRAIEIEIKLQTVFLRAIDVISGDGDGLVRKALNAFDNGTRRSCVVEDRGGIPNDQEYADHDGQRGDAAQQPEPGARQQSGRDTERNDCGKGSRHQGSATPPQMVNHRNRRGQESDKNKQSAESSMSGREERR